MKIRLNPEHYGNEESDGVHCEWVISDEKLQGCFYTFEPVEELPDGGKPGHRSYLTHRTFSDENFKEQVKNSMIFLVENNNIRYNKKEHIL